jgi:hypothetical protein
MTLLYSPSVAAFLNLAGPDAVILLVTGCMLWMLWMLIDCIAFEPGIAAKLGWCLLIACFPLFGALIYSLTARRTRKRAKSQQ